MGTRVNLCPSRDTGTPGEKVQRSTSTCCLLPGTPRLSGDVRSKEENDFLKKIKFKAIKLYLNQLNFIKLNLKIIKINSFK